MTQRQDPQLELPLGGRALGAKPGRAAACGRLALPRRWHDGVRLPFLGREIVLRLDAAAQDAALIGGVLHLPLPPQAAEAQVKDRAQGWLQTEARRVLGELLASCAGRLGVEPPRWQLSFSAGSWAAREAGGRLRLSWRLVHLAPDEIGRVLSEQLARLRQPAPAQDLWGHAAPVPA